MSGELSAGYCGHCNRAVTIRKKSSGGLLRKMTSIFSSDGGESEWECTKCGQPAGKSFVPHVNHEAVTDATAAESSTAAPADSAGPGGGIPALDVNEYRDCPHCRGSIRREAFKCLHCQLEVPPLSKLAEASCHICGNLLKYEGSAIGQLVLCPTCTGTICLPPPAGDRVVKTTPPPVVKLPDDPARPTLTLALCVACEHQLTYQKKHAGRKVTCPSCKKPLVLP